MSAFPHFQVASGLIHLDHSTRLPLRIRDGVAEIAVGADLLPERRGEIEEILYLHGCAAIRWRDESWVKLPARISGPMAHKPPQGLRLRWRRVPSALLDPEHPVQRRVGHIPPAVPEANLYTDLPHAIALREDSRDLLLRNRGRYRLTNAEFSVLWSLWRAMGKVVTRSALISSMYGAFDEPESANNILSIVVCRCRKKLGQHARIENCWGIGYRILPADHPEFGDPFLGARGP